MLFYGKKQKNIIYKERECCYGICEDSGKILLVYSQKDKNYSIPGGGMEPGESQTDALKREFLEEAGVNVVKNKFLTDLETYTKNNKGIFIHRIAHIYIVKVDINSKTTPIEDWHTANFYNIDETLLLMEKHQTSLNVAFKYYLNNKIPF